MKLSTDRCNHRKQGNLYVSGVQWDRASVLALLPLIDCKGCGKCCAIPRLVQPQELERIAEHPNGTADPSWVESIPCRFRSKAGCAVHPVRPVVCKYFPLARVEHEGHEVVAVAVEYCDAGRRAIAQLQEWQG